MALCWKIYEIGKGKCCEKLNLTCETRQVQELVCNSCLPGREVLREEHVPSTEEMLWLLRHFVFNHCWPCCVWRLHRVQGMSTGTAQLAETSLNMELTNREQWGEQTLKKICKSWIIYFWFPDGNFKRHYFWPRCACLHRHNLMKLFYLFPPWASKVRKILFLF